VTVLGASSYMYAEATHTKQLPEWMAAFVYDQLKSGVTVPCRYKPGIQRPYAELGTHCGTTILPCGRPQARQGQGRGRRAGGEAVDRQGQEPRQAENAPGAASSRFRAGKPERLPRSPVPP